jgi:hypothetical protein
MQIQVAEIRTEVKIQFKEVFARYGLQLGHLGISLRI